MRIPGSQMALVQPEVKADTLVLYIRRINILIPEKKARHLQTTFSSDLFSTLHVYIEIQLTTVFHGTVNNSG